MELFNANNVQKTVQIIAGLFLSCAVEKYKLTDRILKSGPVAKILRASVRIEFYRNVILLLVAAE